MTKVVHPNYIGNISRYYRRGLKDLTIVPTAAATCGISGKRPSRVSVDTLPVLGTTTDEVACTTGCAASTTETFVVVFGDFPNVESQVKIHLIPLSILLF